MNTPTPALFVVNGDAATEIVFPSDEVIASEVPGIAVPALSFSATVKLEDAATSMDALPVIVIVDPATGITIVFTIEPTVTVTVIFRLEWSAPVVNIAVAFPFVSVVLETLVKVPEEAANATTWAATPTLDAFLENAVIVTPVVLSAESRETADANSSIEVTVDTVGVVPPDVLPGFPPPPQAATAIASSINNQTFK